MKRWILLFVFVLFLVGCKSPCLQEVEFKGNCEAYLTAYQYYPEDGLCFKLQASGCSVDSPFSSMKECMKTCGGDFGFHLISDVFIPCGQQYAVSAYMDG